MSRLAAGDARSRPAGTVRAALALRVLAALALSVSAFIHLDLATGPLYADAAVTVAGLFAGQAVVAGVCALWVLVRGSRPAWWASGAVGLVSLAALVVSVYVLVPAVGPLPTVYEPFWYAEKVVAAVAAGVAAAAALAALLGPWRRRRPR